MTSTFQSTHPCGVRPLRRPADVPLSRVSIHAPLRGATFFRGLLRALQLGFQSTHPCGVRPVAVVLPPLLSSFNPRTPAGCDLKIVISAQRSTVSIHAPLRGATSRAPPTPADQYVSIHAPLRGATSQHYRDYDIITKFQSTHPCGVRPFFLPTQTYTHRRFNPRTPAGCDFVLGTTDHLRSSFNPRTPAGCDRHGERTHPGDRQFQSTHPCGVRLRSRPQIHRRMRSFNPRTPAGCDLVLRNRWWLKVLPFQSTHPCGVRPASSAWGSSIPSRFQSTHPCGVRPWSGGHRPRHDRGFNPRTPAGCDFRCCRMGFFH